MASRLLPRVEYPPFAEWFIIGSAECERAETLTPTSESRSGRFPAGSKPYLPPLLGRRPTSFRSLLIPNRFNGQFPFYAKEAGEPAGKMCIQEHESWNA